MIYNHEKGGVIVERLHLPEGDRECGISFLCQKSVEETYPMHCHDFYEIFFVVRGQAMHHINGESESCTPGMLALIRPDDCHAYSFINHWDIELISMGIDPKLMEEVLAFIGIPLKALLEDTAVRRVQLTAQAAAQTLRDLTRLDGIQNVEQRRSFGKVLLARFLLEIETTHATPPQIPEWLYRLLEEMAEPENFKAGLRRMVELSHVSQHHLNREMKRCLGMTPTAYINAKRITLAGELLLTGRYTSMEVAELSGFETLSHFHDNFRKINGCAPREFAARQGKERK